MAVVDDSELARELEWCEGVSAKLNLTHERDLDKNALKARASLKNALDGAVRAYRVVLAAIRKYEAPVSKRGFHDLLRKRMMLQARLLSLMAQRGRLELKLANDPSMSSRWEEIFERIEAGEALVNRLNDALPKS